MIYLKPKILDYEIHFNLLDFSQLRHANKYFQLFNFTTDAYYQENHKLSAHFHLIAFNVTILTVDIYRDKQSEPPLWPGDPWGE